ncbi:MAG: hypothetical protein ACXVWW_09870 [Nocardioides sp.]
MSRYAERTKLVSTALASVARKPRGTPSIERDGASARDARRRAKQIAEGDGAPPAYERPRGRPWLQPSP